jgi:hypothetical protein
MSNYDPVFASVVGSGGGVVRVLIDAVPQNHVTGVLRNLKLRTAVPARMKIMSIQPRPCGLLRSHW